MAFIDFEGEQVSTLVQPPACLDLTNTNRAGFHARLFPLWEYFSREDGWVPKLSRALARFVSRFIHRVEDFEQQFDPRTADELLDEWEQLYEVIVAPGTSLADRRALILAEVRSTGGSTARYYESVAEDFGYPGAQVTDAGFPATCNGTCNQALLGGEWLLTFRLTAATQGAARDAVLADLINGQLLAGWFAVYTFA